MPPSAFPALSAHTLNSLRTSISRRTALTIAVVVLSAIVGALAGRWLVSDPGPGDRQTLSRDIPLLAGSGLMTYGSGRAL